MLRVLYKRQRITLTLVYALSVLHYYSLKGHISDYICTCSYSSYYILDLVASQWFHPISSPSFPPLPPYSSSYQLWCHAAGCPGFAAEQAGPSCPGHGWLPSDEGRCQHTKWVQRCHAVLATAGRTGEETGGSRVHCELHNCFINVHVLCQCNTLMPIYQLLPPFGLTCTHTVV